MKKTDPDYYNGLNSVSTIDLSQLQMDMGVNFSLNRYEPSIENLFNSLQHIQPIELSKYSLDKSKDGHYYVNNKDYYDNERQITQYLEAHGYGEIIPGLTLEGELTPNKVVDISVSYNNQYKCWIPVEIE